MHYYLIAGEASGDLHASHLIAALKAEDPQAEFRGFGGDLMAAEGMALIRHYRELAYMGVIDVALHARTILRGLKQCKKDIVAWQPDVVILVDYPGFNMKIAKFIHSQRLKARNRNPRIFYYIAPKLWAWKEWRIKALRRDVDEVFSILPFEVEFFQDKHGVPVHYIGNPSVDEIANYLASHPRTLPGKGRRERGATDSKALIAILCGSRMGEVRDNLWMMLAAAAAHDTDFGIEIAAMSVIPRKIYEESIAKAEAYVGRKIRAKPVFDATYHILARATAALVTSGTATLETAIFGVPQVVCYNKRYPWLMAAARRLLLKVPFVSLVNLIAGREVVKELILTDMNPEDCRRELEAILPGGNRHDTTLEGYAELSRRLGAPGAPQRAAQQISNLNFDL